MQSFRTELENPVVERDILELERKIRAYREGTIDEEKFRSLRLARGVYGQRQQGVQMIRIKIPYGKLSARQLHHIADLADEYSNGVLHATTRQDIQIHYVSLDRTPELWARLEEEQITLREACGNTVRNITADALAGVSPDEPFDVSPYAQAAFEYFLRNPVCQDMGRKFKIAFSANAQDAALAKIHDLGFIPKLNAQGQRGFEVWIAGGLGAQPHLALLAKAFLPEEELIPFTEATLRVFDRYGERARRHKARFKFLLQDLGLEELLALIDAEKTALPHHHYPIDSRVEAPTLPPPVTPETPTDTTYYHQWLEANVAAQRQKGYHTVRICLPLGNMTSDTARAFAAVVPQFAADDIRITIGQGYLLRYVRTEALPGLFNALHALDLTRLGAESTADITACPGTDTCNLGIASSTGMAQALDTVIRKEYPDLIHNHDINIKISGCPNGCGQHSIAAIGFHGSSLKHGGKVVPAVQVMIGGNRDRVADKVIKLPAKRGPEALRQLLEDYLQNSLEGEYFTDYYLRQVAQEERYFYQLLKPLADTATLQPADYIDWGHAEDFAVAAGVGECAGVVIDLVATLLYEADEKVAWAHESLAQQAYADAIYHAYTTFVHTAKALLLTTKAKTNSQYAILKAFDEAFAEELTAFGLPEGIKTKALQINQFTPEQAFATRYLAEAVDFLTKAKASRGL
ncbi:nitrite/sulfite reductase [Eisenibacter elegans]|uniref:nitrite/sulfite reductase n=1 Tax=Eisenibacter elegans TaxID=997 RepID=UPI00047EB4A5|nr:nitrite/sulfite reductase [Eisenibacter elegans]